MAFSPKVGLTTPLLCNAPPETAASVFKAIGPGKNTPKAVIVAHSMTHDKKIATPRISTN